MYHGRLVRLIYILILGVDGCRQLEPGAPSLLRFCSKRLPQNPAQLGELAPVALWRVLPVEVKAVEVVLPEVVYHVVGKRRHCGGGDGELLQQQGLT